jgi:septum formation protein
VLASASPARRRLLEQAGFAPDVRVSGVDEEACATIEPAELVRELAAAKARAVASLVGGDALVIGCDSVLDVDGVVHGKPATVDEARERLQRLRGRTAVLRTGHHLVAVATGAEAAGTVATVVQFGDYDEDELEAYLATGEPLEVAGAFTLDGYAAPFVERIEGDASNVIGLSLPMLRRLLREVGVEVRDLWVPR